MKIRSIAQLIIAAIPMFSYARPMMIQTTGGSIPANGTGIMLPHEHIVVDLRGPTATNYGVVDVEHVVQVMKPNIISAKTKGIDIFVECSSIGVGRNVASSARLAKETGMHIVIPTGVYGRGEFAPATYRAMSEGELSEWMVKELTIGIDDSGVKAGFIKLACDDTPLTDFQKKQLRAAARASIKTGAIIASHSVSGTRTVEQADILTEAGLSLNRFIWVHAQYEKDLEVHKKLAARGVHIEFDNINDDPNRNAGLIKLIQFMNEAGFADRILLSQDSGWYQPGKEGGGEQKPYTYIIDAFIPAMRAAGLEEALIKQLTVENPRRAFAMSPPEAQ